MILFGNCESKYIQTFLTHFKMPTQCMLDSVHINGISLDF